MKRFISIGVALSNSFLNSRDRGRQPFPAPRAKSISQARRDCRIRQGASYFCFTAIAEISIRALLTRAAAWIVARAGLGSGIRLLYTLFMSGNS